MTHAVSSRRRARSGAAVFLFLLLLPLAGCSGEDGSVDFVSPSCACVDGNINVRVDGVSQGIMVCGTTLSIPVKAGDHTVEASDRSGGWGPTSIVVDGGTPFRFELGC